MHYPGHLRETFVAALEDYLVGTSGALEVFFYDEDKQRLWNGMDTDNRLQWTAGQPWHCTDVMPGHVCRELDMNADPTYAQACRRTRQGLIGPLQPV
jgi:hypothetical protein